MGYSGFASILAVAVAPWIGLWVFDHGGWTAAVPRSGGAEPDDGGPRVAPAAGHAASTQPRSLHPSDLVEWRVLVGAVTLFLYSFSYGGITSFVARLRRTRSA